MPKFGRYIVSFGFFGRTGVVFAQKRSGQLRSADSESLREAQKRSGGSETHRELKRSERFRNAQGSSETLREAKTRSERFRNAQSSSETLTKIQERSGKLRNAQGVQKRSDRFKNAQGGSEIPQTPQLGIFF